MGSWDDTKQNSEASNSTVAPDQRKRQAFVVGWCKIEPLAASGAGLFKSRDMIDQQPSNNAIDLSKTRTYGIAMQRGQPFIELKLDIEESIELSDFVGAFTSLGAEYDRYVRAQRPDLKPDASLYVKEVKRGCIVAELVPWLPIVVQQLDAALVVEDFVRRWGKRIGTYRLPGGRLEDTSRSELADVIEQVAAVANASNGALRVAAVSIKDGVREEHASFQFDVKDSREIRDRVEEHRKELSYGASASHHRKTMIFTRMDVNRAKLGKRSGELVEFPQIEEGRSLPLIYASPLAEERIKHEIREAEDNVFKKGFVVDLNVESRKKRPYAYAVTAFHDVIDLPDED